MYAFIEKLRQFKTAIIHSWVVALLSVCHISYPVIMASTQIRINGVFFLADLPHMRSLIGKSRPINDGRYNTSKHNTAADTDILRERFCVQRLYTVQAHTAATC